MPLLVSLRFSLYSFFTMLIMAPLSQDTSQPGRQFLKRFSNHNRNIIIIFVGVMALVASLLAFGQSLKIVSVIIGAISILIAIAYTSIAYRLFVLLTTVSRETPGSMQANTYDDIARFTLSVSGMYDIGHVCQSFMYLSSVFSPQFYKFS